MGVLWVQVVHKNNWGELTHLNDSWVVHHQAVLDLFIPPPPLGVLDLFTRYYYNPYDPYVWYIC